MHSDALGSVVLTTQGQTVTGGRFYRAYGAKRSGNDFSFERNYTGQHLDDTGLLYYGARYYDPTAGRFISPDSLIPDPGNVLDYNRYLYARGNPLKYNDPSGHCAEAGLSPVPCQWVAQQGMQFLQRYGPQLVQWGQQALQLGQPWADKLPGAVDWYFSSGGNTQNLPQNAPQGGNTAGPGGLDPNDFNGIRRAFQQSYGNVPGAESVMKSLDQGGNPATGASWQARYALQYLNPADVTAFEQRQGGGIVDIVTSQGSRISFVENKVISNWYALGNSEFASRRAQDWLEQVYKQDPQMVYSKIVIETNARLPQSFIQFFEQEGIRVEQYLR